MKVKPLEWCLEETMLEVSVICTNSSKNRSRTEGQNYMPHDVLVTKIPSIFDFLENPESGDLSKSNKTYHIDLLSFDKKKF